MDSRVKNYHRMQAILLGASQGLVVGFFLLFPVSLFIDEGWIKVFLFVLSFVYLAVGLYIWNKISGLRLRYTDHLRDTE